VIQRAQDKSARPVARSGTAIFPFDLRNPALALLLLAALTSCAGASPGSGDAATAAAEDVATHTVRRAISPGGCDPRLSQDKAPASVEAQPATPAPPLGWLGRLRRLFSLTLGGGRPHELDTAPLRQTFCETFDAPLDISYPGINPKGRWKTNYWFGSDGYAHEYDGQTSVWQDGPSSRMIDREFQVYSDPFYEPNLPSPFAVKAGALTISAYKNPDRVNSKLVNPRTGKAADYVSGLITTEKSFRQTYGYFEATVTLSSVDGAFPAFWLLGEPYTAYTGDEIDIFEHLGKYPQKLWLNTHMPRLGEVKTPGAVVGIDDPSIPHAIGLLWTPDRLTWFVDRHAVFSGPNQGFHKPMYLLLNLAVGGWDGNAPQDPDSFRPAFKVHSVKAWALPDATRSR
jgi:beta-glucanase (GH16 family)